MSLDERLLRAARTCWHTPAAERVVGRFSMLGEHGAVWLALAAGGFLLAPREARGGWRRAGATVVLTYGANTALKLVIGRRRPELEGLPPLTRTPTKLGFPSAHASTSFAAALCFGRLGLPSGPLYGMASALALSRLYLGVHHPSDLLGGALLGTALGAALGPGPA